MLGAFSSCRAQLLRMKPKVWSPIWFIQVTEWGSWVPASLLLSGPQAVPPLHPPRVLQATSGRLQPCRLGSGCCRQSRVQKLQGTLLGSPLLCLAAACQLHPHHHSYYGAGVSACSFLFCCCSPCYSPGRAPSRGWQSSPALYSKWQPGLADAQAHSRSGHVIPRAWVAPSCVTHQHPALFDAQFVSSRLQKGVRARRSPNGP